MDGGTGLDMAYSNPILAGFHPDPSIVRVGDDYYLANSTFQWWPSITLHHSRDLIHWTPLGYALDQLTQLDLHGVDDSMGLWAPTLRHFDGVFYLIVSLVRQIAPGVREPLNIENYLWTATDIRGPWSTPVYISDTGIDPDIFRDVDGRIYVTTNMVSNADAGQEGIVLREYDPAREELIGPSHLLWGGTELGITEAPHLLFRNGWHYLMTAEGGTAYDHAVQLCRSRSLFGPYELAPGSPILTMRGNDAVFACSGHADLVETQNGEWWMVLLACRPTANRNRILGRETFLLPCTWTGDDWLVVNGGRSVETGLEGPDLPPSPAAPAAEGFGNDTLNTNWQAVRYLSPEHFSLSEGVMRLRARPHPLHDINAVNVIGRRQQHLHFSAEVALEFDAGTNGQRAGLACYYDRLHFIYLSLGWQDGPILELTRRDGDNVETVSVPWPLGPAVRLRVEGCEEDYRFFARTGDGEWVPIGDIQDGSILSDEHAGVVVRWAAFTGTFICLFTTSNGARSDLWATFHDFEYAGVGS